MVHAIAQRSGLGTPPPAPVRPRSRLAAPFVLDRRRRRRLHVLGHALCAEKYNSVLCNLYRDGRDSMGWHSDDEAELGPQPCIASLSLGATRRFRLRHRRDPEQRLELDLVSGSLLLMTGATQRNYRHDLPKSARVTKPRINLTFRAIVIIPDQKAGHPWAHQSWCDHP